MTSCPNGHTAILTTYRSTTDKRPNNEAIAEQLKALLTPAIWAQRGYYRQLGMRARILNLSLMVAAVLTLLWRQVGLDLARTLLANS